MSPENEPERRPTQIIVETGEILQKLNPSRLATLLFVIDDTIQTQTEMADILGISSSTITTYLQTLANSPVPLAQKRGTQYSITSEGKTVISLYDQTISSLGKKLSSVDWGDETDKEQIGELLAPLPNSRSSIPFFVLCSIADRSDLADTQGVAITNIVTDVKYWEQERGQTATRKQVRWMLSQFEEADAIKFNEQGQNVILEDKGDDLVQLLEGLIEILEDDQADTSGETKSLQSSTQQDSAAGGTTGQSTGINNTGRVGPQPRMHPFSTGGQAAIDDSEAVTTLVPTYCLSTTNAESDEGTQPQSQPKPVLRLTPTMSVDELFERASQLRHEHPDAQLELNWVLWSDEPTESEEDEDIHDWISNK